MTGKWHGGKGSSYRPVVDRKQFEDNWDKIFGKKDEEAKEEESGEAAEPSEPRDMGMPGR